MVDYVNVFDNVSIDFKFFLKLQNNKNRRSIKRFFFQIHC